jgi:hypothetical protein
MIGGPVDERCCADLTLEPDEFRLSVLLFALASFRTTGPRKRTDTGIIASGAKKN